MIEFTKQANAVQTIALESKIVQAQWCQKMVIEEKQIDFEVYTEFVGNGSKIKIIVKDKKGKTVATTDGRVFGNYFAETVTIPKKAYKEIKFKASLTKHGIEKESGPAQVLPRVEVINQKWSKDEARRGDVLKLTADVKYAPDNTEAKIYIFEYDRDGAHDLITQFKTLIKGEKVDVEWAYEYHEDTDEIPTQEELEEYGNRYNPPEYFWVLGIGKERYGNKDAPGLLTFRDWIELELLDDAGAPMANAEYTIYLADGSEQSGTLDGDGKARIEDAPPGRFSVYYPILER